MHLPVKYPRHHPLTAGIDDLFGARRRSFSARGDLPIAYSNPAAKHHTIGLDNISLYNQIKVTHGSLPFR
jgi:hypothetical protein